MRFALVACVLRACSAMDARSTAQHRSLAKAAETQRVAEAGAVPYGASFVQDGSGFGFTTQGIGSDNSDEMTQIIRDYTLEKPALAQRDAKEKTCKARIDNCFAECDSMFWFYIDVVTQKFHGLKFLPLQHVTNPEEVKEKATTPVLNEGAYLFCGLQNCLETQCKGVCTNDEQYSDELTDPKSPEDVLGEQCQLVEVKKRKYIQQWLSEAHIKPTLPYLTIPDCRSVCGPKEPANFIAENELKLWANNDVVNMPRGGATVSARLELLLLAVAWTGVNFW